MGDFVNNFKAEWSGGWPALCFGEWNISYNEKALTIPEENKTQPMNTYNTYQSWHFEDWEEVFESNEGGLYFDEWIMENHSWVDSAFDKLEIEKFEANYKDLYDAIQSEDFRHGSCGGCI